MRLIVKEMFGSICYFTLQDFSKKGLSLIFAMYLSNKLMIDTRNGCMEYNLAGM